MPRLKIIPVVDLKGGVVVHAREGRRPEYRPVQSTLCRGADPVVLVEAFLRLYPFPVIYVADLDAIAGTGNHRALLQQLRKRFPHVEFWVDGGVSDVASLDGWLEARIGRMVLGSESLKDAHFVHTARRRCGDCEPVLSLDFSGDAFNGPQALLQDAGRFWPSRVLAMNVKRVGSGAGPDLDLVIALASRKSDAACQVYAAGGVRSALDLLQLAAAGAAGALVATALHEGTLAAADIEHFAGKAQRVEKTKPAP